MKEITIRKVDNGFVVEITFNGVQTVYDREEVFIAKNKKELLELLKEKV